MTSAPVADAKTQARQARDAFNELGARACSVDGRKKDGGYSFCRSCYRSLPSNLRHALYETGDKYPPAHFAAKEHLLAARNSEQEVRCG